MVFCNLDNEYGVYEPINGHNPYFNRWFSAIIVAPSYHRVVPRHNPYFNRWFSAIGKNHKGEFDYLSVTILILIDGFLQYSIAIDYNNEPFVTILILIDGFLQFYRQICTINWY